MSNRLSGKVCIITGTGGGIGREAALTFAREGALVVGCGLFVEEATVAAVRAAGGTMVSVQPCDLTKPGDCQALVDVAVRTFGRVDVLFNNAALAYFNWLEDISDEEWDRNRRSEVDLVFYLTRAAWPCLKASRGVVVNTASLTALMSFKNLENFLAVVKQEVSARHGTVLIPTCAVSRTNRDMNLLQTSHKKKKCSRLGCTSSTNGSRIYGLVTIVVPRGRTNR